MEKESLVAVFPAAFAAGSAARLASNVRGILKIRGLGHGGISRDGPLIIVRAHDPVLASSAIGLLYGIRRVAIATRTGPDAQSARKEIARIASGLLLQEDRFFVRAEGQAPDAELADLELGATSDIVGGPKKASAGTASSYDKLLYAYVTRSNTYACIYSDDGLGGMPYGSQKAKMFCCIFDELSAIACLQAVKCGFEVQIAVCYADSAHLMRLAKMVNCILPKTALNRQEVWFYHAGRAGRDALAGIAEAVSRTAAAKAGMRRVCLPVSPAFCSPDQIDMLIGRAHKDGLVPYMLLGGLEDEVFRTAREAGLERFTGNSFRRSGLPKYGGKDDRLADAALKSKKTLVIKTGPNNVHDMLDGLGEAPKK